ncbi:MAG: GTP-binding protein [Trueperaceae bacterium]|nr:GTP-binding protein [Trueperaceae bacterium]
MSRTVLVQVVGPPGAGKTTLIERLVRSTRNEMLAAVRVVEEEGGDTVARDEDGAEVASWRAAGALLPERVRLPAGHFGGVHAALQACGAGPSVADVVLIEGGPVTSRAVDVVVFVTRALQSEASLTVDEGREIGRMDGGEALSLMLGLTPPSEDEDEEAGMPGEGDAVDDDDVEVVETYEIPEPAAQRIRELLEHGHPIVQRGRWLRAGYEPLVHAQVIVVGRGADGDRVLGERTKGMIEAALEDEELRRTYPELGSVHRRTILAADLAEAGNAEARKAVEAIKRRWRRAAW